MTDIKQDELLSTEANLLVQFQRLRQDLKQEYDDLYKDVQIKNHRMSEIQKLQARLKHATGPIDGQLFTNKFDPPSPVEIFEAEKRTRTRKLNYDKTVLDFLSGPDAPVEGYTTQELTDLILEIRPDLHRNILIKGIRNAASRLKKAKFLIGEPVSPNNKITKRYKLSNKPGNL